MALRCLKFFMVHIVEIFLVLVNGEYQKQSVSYNDTYRYYQDFFIEINKKFNKKVKGTFVYSHQFYNRNIIQSGSSSAENTLRRARSAGIGVFLIQSPLQ